MKTTFAKSIERFTNKDLDNFGACMAQTEVAGRYIEYRVRKEDNRLCIIEFYRNAGGYSIFVQEDN
jgi:hypothetical protein